MRRFRRQLIAGALAGLLAVVFAWTLVQRETRAEVTQVPQDQGIAGLAQLLRRLNTTARLMHTTAHPDDEDGGMLALESRGQGATVMLLTLNRGEGGQNKVGSELFDELGVLRTLELLEAGQYYGVEQRFTRVVDFGFSKTADETLERWHGHDVALADMVRAIRTFRPDVIASRFQGAARDGHGNHQVAGILTPEAYRAAADPSRFPEQIAEGLQPWQASKLYTDNVRSNEDYTLRLDTNIADPALGLTFARMALNGLGHQRSQGWGDFVLPAGHMYTYYRLLDSKVATPGLHGQKEESFFDGIDTTLPGLAQRVSGEQSKATFLPAALEQISGKVQEARRKFDLDHPERIAPALLDGLGLTSALISRISASDLSPEAKADLLARLRTKREQFTRAANLALGVELQLTVDGASGNGASAFGFPRPAPTFMMAVPGQTFTLTARFVNRGKQEVVPQEIKLRLPTGWEEKAIKQELKPLAEGEVAQEQFQVTVSPGAAYTRPYWHRQDSQQAVYDLDDAQMAGLPLPAYPVQALATYTFDHAQGEADAVAQVQYIDPVDGQEQRPLAVGPALSVKIDPPTDVISVAHTGEVGVRVSVLSDVVDPLKAKVKLDAPRGWTVTPPTQTVSFAHEGDTANVDFTVHPAALKEGFYRVTAEAEYAGETYREGYTVLTRHDLGTFYYYSPAVQSVSGVNVSLPRGLKVGYIMGAGDEIPAVLKRLGIDVEVLSPSDLAHGDLSQYETLVTGIRAYDVRADVRQNNSRLLDFVKAGGTLVVQYNQDVRAFNAGQYTPYPATATTQRVSVEEAPVQLLAPQDGVFHFPNEITPHDFDGWIQERGVYFMTNWDKSFTPLLSSHDPGESPLGGGLLRASYGKGNYIYTGYVFFRQLPAGIPGAVRLFVNLLSVGHEK